jgi:hypothetical protein
MKKRDTIEDPYEAARKFLPSNSTINCPFEIPDEYEKESFERYLKNIAHYINYTNELGLSNKTQSTSRLATDINPLFVNEILNLTIIFCCFWTIYYLWTYLSN